MGSSVSSAVANLYMEEEVESRTLITFTGAAPSLSKVELYFSSCVELACKQFRLHCSLIEMKREYIHDSITHNIVSYRQGIELKCQRCPFLTW